MTTSEDASNTALRYVRDELATLRGSVRDDMSTLRAAIDLLSNQLRLFGVEQLPRIAVLERRADDAHADVLELKADRAADKRARGQLVTGLVVGLVVAVVSAVLAWLPHLLGT